MARVAPVRRALDGWRSPVRTGFAVAAGAAMLYLLLWAAAWRGAGKLTDGLLGLGLPEYRTLWVKPGGTIVFTDFRLRSPDPAAADVLSARRLELETPGLSWVARSGFRPSDSVASAPGTVSPAAFPAASRLRLRAEGLVAGADLVVGDLRWIGLASGAPLDGVGCEGSGRFSGTRLAEMGLGEGATVAEASLELLGRDRARIGLSIEHRSASRIELDMTVRSEPARTLLDADWSKWVILERRWRVRDAGFVSARNRWCAQRLGISRDGFVDRHLAAIRRELGAAGLAPTAELEAAYRRYATRGGDLTWQSRPSLTTPVGQMATFALRERLRILDASLESLRGRPVAFSFNAAPRPALPEPAGDAAAPDAGLAPSVDAVAPRPAAAPSASPATPPRSSGEPARPIAAEAVPPNPMAPPADPVEREARAGEISGRRAPESGGSLSSAAGRATEPGAGQRRQPAAGTLAGDGGGRIAAAPSASQPRVVRPGSSVAYPELEALQGSRVEVRSVYGSLRAGRLLKYTDAAITVVLERDERGFAVTMPQATVDSVRVLGPGGPTDAPPPR
jgi:hypothetical protein